MTKFFFLLLFVFINFTLIDFAVADYKPENEHFSANEVQIKAFKRFGQLAYYTQLMLGNSGPDESQNQIKLGSYYRYGHKNKIGIAGIYSNGRRHTNDWVKPNNSWEWEDTKSRYESLIELSYSKKFSPIHNVPLSFELKNLYLVNLNNSEQSYILKPGLSYFWVQNLTPKYSIHLSAPIYFPLNFEKNIFYKTGLYLGALYHFSQSYQFGSFFKYSKITWTESEEFKDTKPKQSYSSSEVETVLGFEIIFQL